MDINFDRKIISNTNRQYLVQDFLETRVSFQTNKPNPKSSFKAKRKTSQMRLWAEIKTHTREFDNLHGKKNWPLLANLSQVFFFIEEQCWHLE